MGARNAASARGLRARGGSKHRPRRGQLQLNPTAPAPQRRRQLPYFPRGANGPHSHHFHPVLRACRAPSRARYGTILAQLALRDTQAAVSGTTPLNELQVALISIGPYPDPAIILIFYCQPNNQAFWNSARQKMSAAHYYRLSVATDW